MALASRVFKLPEETGDVREDLKRLRKAISDHFTDLQRKGSLAISTIQYWTPVPTFDTPGDVAFTPTTQWGAYTLTERTLEAEFRLVGAITHTTAAGNLRVTGLPIAASADTRDTGGIWDGELVWGGITLATAHTDLKCSIVSGSATLLVSKCGTALAASSVAFGDVPTGGTLNLRGNIRFRI